MSVSRRGFLVGGLAAGTGLANGVGPVLAQTKDAAVAAGHGMAFTPALQSAAQSRSGSEP